MGFEVNKETLQAVVEANKSSKSFFVTEDGHFFTENNKSHALNHASGRKTRWKQIDQEGNEISKSKEEITEDESEYKPVLEIVQYGDLTPGEKAEKEAKEKAAIEAEEKAVKEAEEKAAIEAEEIAAKEAEEKAAKDAEEKAAKDAEEKAAIEAEEKAAKEAEENAAKETEEKAAKEAAGKNASTTKKQTKNTSK